MTLYRYIDYDTGKTVGAHSGKESLTIGQRALIGGCSDRYVVLSLTAKSGIIQPSEFHHAIHLNCTNLCDMYLSNL